MLRSRLLGEGFPEGSLEGSSGGSSEGAQRASLGWRRLYSRQAAEACLAQVRGVRYGERVSLGGGAITAEALPSGAGLGTAAWSLISGPTRCGSQLC